MSSRKRYIAGNVGLDQESKKLVRVSCIRNVVSS